MGERLKWERCLTRKDWTVNPDDIDCKTGEFTLSKRGTDTVIDIQRTATHCAIAVRSNRQESRQLYLKARDEDSKLRREDSQ